MAFRLTVEDCGGEDHYITIEDDGHITYDPKVHDVDLERSLVELGAAEPKCLSFELRYTMNPFRMVDDVHDMLRHAPDITFYKTGINSLLACDFIEHVLRTVPDLSSDRADLLHEGLTWARTYYALPYILLPYNERPSDADTAYKLHVAKNMVVRTSDIMALGIYREKPASGRSATDRRSREAIKLLSLAFMLIARGVSRNTFDGNHIDEVSRICIRATPSADTDSEVITRREALAQYDEHRWQVARTVAVLTAIIKGKPWPSL
jgi:hypothetical protein